MTIGKRYLGDAVYVEFDGYMLKLTTEDGMVNPTNTIYLEPAVYTQLVRYVADLKAAHDHEHRPDLSI